MRGQAGCRPGRPLTAQGAPLSVRPNRPPSWEHPLGTDRQGRDLLAVTSEATPLTLYVGLLAGSLGVAIGTTLALVVASRAWPVPARTIRAQALSIKEPAYVQVARLSGASGARIVFLEIMPNLLPYLAATFVGAVSAAILASIGLEIPGLGVIEANTVGITLYWVNYSSALLHGMWWWFLPPVIIIILLFIGLFLISAGLDDVAKPRRRRAA